MNNHKRWTPDEELVVRDLVATHGPSGITMAAKQLNRTKRAVELHAYTVLKISFKKRITEKEMKHRKSVIEKHIKENPGNIQKALKKAAEDLNLSSVTLKNYYYNKQSKIHRHNLSPCFAVIGKSYTTNSKIFTAKRTTKNKLIENIKYLISKLWK